MFIKERARKAFEVLRTLVIICLLQTLASPVFAQWQKPILVHNADTTYLITEVVLDSITVEASRFLTQTGFDDLIRVSDLTTSISGVTKDLYRDYPSMVRLYTPQGIPILTKYILNNGLTASFPDSALGFTLRQPGAMYPNPDAPVVFVPNYRSSAVLLSPLSQHGYLATGRGNPVSAGATFAHAGGAKAFEQLIPELKIFNTSYSGSGFLRADIGKSKTELLVHHSRSFNEYGELVNVQRLREEEYSTSVFINSFFQLGGVTLDIGVASQHGEDHRAVGETNISYREDNAVNANTYTMGLQSSRTELRAMYHELNRLYAYGPRDTVTMRRVETMVSRNQHLWSNTTLTAQARFDHTDRELSASADLQVDFTDNVLLIVSGGRLYDAVGSEGLNNLMRSVQVGPHPWTTWYVGVRSDVFLGKTTLNVSLDHKLIQRGWYGYSALSEGLVGRVGAKGRLFGVDSINDKYLKWSIGGVVRDLSLEVNGELPQRLPGPAQFEGHASLQAGVGNMHYTMEVDVFMENYMRVRKDVTMSLGDHIFVSMAVSRAMGPVSVGTSFHNILAVFGEQNNIYGYYSESKGEQLLAMPPIVNAHVAIGF